MWSVKWILFCSSAISNINKKEKLAILSSNDVRCLTAPPLDPHWKLANISFTEENLAAASSADSKFQTKLSLLLVHPYYRIQIFMISARTMFTFSLLNLSGKAKQNYLKNIHAWLQSRNMGNSINFSYMRSSLRQTEKFWR